MNETYNLLRAREAELEKELDVIRSCLRQIDPGTKGGKTGGKTSRRGRPAKAAKTPGPAKRRGRPAKVASDTGAPKRRGRPAKTDAA